MAGLAVLFLAATLGAASPFPDDHDGVNFVLGVQRFDIQWHQPHFPGYPVYIAAARVMAVPAGSEEWGLIAVSAISMTAAIAAMIAMPRLPASGAVALTAAMMANPAVFQFSHKIFSEPMGLGLLCLSALAVHGSGSGTPRWTLAGILLGLMLGVRLSWWPFALGFGAAAFQAGRLAPLAAGMTLGNAAWLAPLSWDLGAAGLLNTGLAFTHGHFTSWGHTAFAAGVTHETGFFLMNIGAMAGAAPGRLGFITGAPMALCVIAGAALGARGHDTNDRPSHARLALLAGAGMYLCWLLAGQNVTKARHFLPFIPVVAIALAPVARLKPAILLLAASIMAAGGLAAHVNRASALPPPLQMRMWLGNNVEQGASVYCGWAERFFDLYPSKVKVYSVPGIPALDLIAGSELAPSKTRLVCDDIPGLRFSGPPLAVFHPRSADLTDVRLRLFSL